jgi:hypothetical protein
VKPAQGIHRDSAAGSTNPALPSAGGTGTTNFIPRWTNRTTLGNSLLFQTTGGNLGLGTTTPIQKFEVDSGNLLVKGPQNFKGKGTTAFVYVGDRNHPIEAINSGSSSRSGGLAIGAYMHPEAVFIADFTGNVGIGTTTPTGGILSTVANSKSVMGVSTVGWNAPSGSGASGTDAIHATGGSGYPAGGQNGGVGVVGTGGASTTVGGVGMAATGGAGGGFAGTGGVGMVVTGGSGFGGGVGLQVSGGASACDGCGPDGIIATGGGPSGNGITVTGANSLTASGGTTGGAGVQATGGVGQFGVNGGPGVVATGGNNTDCFGHAGDGIDAFAGTGTVGAPNGLAGSFTGDVHISGKLNVSGTKSFRIDHPLDPANRYLYHAALESSEVLNLYTGNVVLDGSGEATVQLPEWFEVLNRDFRYQLTAVGAPAPNLHVAQEIQNHSFRIGGGAGGIKVSWQVTAVRQDAWEKVHPMAVEVEKPPRERGYYINIELFGAPPERSIDWAREPQQMKRMRDIQQKQLMQPKPVKPERIGKAVENRLMTGSPPRT